MLRSARNRALLVLKGAALFWGAALTVALVVGVATMALAAVPGDPFRLGQTNGIDTMSTLVGDVAGTMLRVDNNSTAAGATALDLRVEAGKAPMKVNSATKVASLNADRLDGKDISAFDASRVIHATGPLPVERTYTSKGGTLIVSASGSGFRSSRLDGYIGMHLVVDGVIEGFSDVYTNELDSHKAFVPSYTVLEGLPAGTHTIRLQAMTFTSCNTASEVQRSHCTTTNLDDFFNVTVVEIPD